MRCVVLTSSNMEWAWLIIASLLEIAAILFMTTMTKSVRNDKGQVIDAGTDVNASGGLGESDLILIHPTMF